MKRTLLRRWLTGLCLGALLAAPPASASYGWPVAPFDRQHPVRGFFNDPRVELKDSFHFGIDVAAPDGTPVYAVESGTVFLGSPSSLSIVADEGGRTFGYWHIDPAVGGHRHVERNELVGWVRDGFGHVHFDEKNRGVYVNPLRPGGIQPYVDVTSPAITGLWASASGRLLDPRRISGAVDLVVDAFDTPSPPLPPPPWADTRVAPAYLRWRIVAVGRTVVPWRTAIDFRSYLAPNTSYREVYAPGTRPNRANRPGRYCFYLVHGWSSATLPDGDYRLEVVAFDSQGNSARARLQITVSNRSRQRQRR